MIIVEGAFLWVPLEYSTDHLVEEARCVSGVKNRSWPFFSLGRFLSLILPPLPVVLH
jgi:hypothetical protein